MSDVGWARDIADVAVNDGGYSFVEREALRVIAAVRADERRAALDKSDRDAWLRAILGLWRDGDINEFSALKAIEAGVTPAGID